MIDMTLHLECGGCFLKATTKATLSRVFKSFSGKGHGWGSYSIEMSEPDYPEGWVPFDPYTGCTYCPDCWASIEGHKSYEGKPSDECVQQGDDCCAG